MYLHDTETTHVNLDSDLQIFLKEIYHLSTMGIKLPERIFQKVRNVDIHTVRSFATRLLTATSQYDIIEKELNDIEKALVQEQLIKAKKVIFCTDSSNVCI